MIHRMPKKDSPTNSIVFILFLTFAFLTHYPSIIGSFVWDDYSLIEQNPVAVQGFTVSTVFSFFTKPFFSFNEPGGTGYYRPLANLNYAVLYSLFKNQHEAFHVFNILIHGLNAFLLFLLSRIFFSVNSSVSFLSSFLFLIHPSFHQCIDYCTGSLDLLALFWILLSLLCLFTWLSKPNFICFGGIMAFLLYSVSIFTKEIAVLCPLTGYLYFIQQAKPIRNKDHLKIISLFLPLVFFILIRKYFIHLSLTPNNTFIQTLAYYETTFKLIFIYLGKFFLPFFPGFMQQYLPLSQDMFPFFILMGMTLFGIVFFKIILILKYPNPLNSDENLFWSGLFWFLITLIPVSNLIPMHPDISNFAIYYSEHLIYLPAIGLCMLIGVLLVRFSKKAQKKARTAINVFLFLLIGMLILQTQKNSFVWGNPVSLYETIIRDNPENPGARINLGIYYNKIKIPQKAILQYQTILSSIEKENLKEDGLASQCLTNIGFSYLQMKKPDIARFYYEKALEINQSNFLALFELGNLSFKENDLLQAMEYINLSLSIKPDFSPAIKKREEIEESLSRASHGISSQGLQP